MSHVVTLPGGHRLQLSGADGYAPPAGPCRSRTAYAAAHVVADPTSDTTPGAPAVLDWEATLAFRRHLWSYGFGVAEAMDTAQRGMGLDYPVVRELISRSAAEARACGGRVVAGVATDQLPPGPASLADVRRAYLEQLEHVQETGAEPVLMCSRHLAAAARHADDYVAVYAELIDRSATPVLLHWLGPAFDPALDGYWGAADLDEASRTVLALIKERSSRIAGIKLSLLDADREVGLRRQLPAGVRMYTGDDFNYPELIRGDAEGHSEALLGIFAAIAPAAATALAALDDGDLATYDRVFAPTVPLSRHIFGTPTYHYKTGVVFLAWLAGHQNHFTMVGGLHSARSAAHLGDLMALADAAGLLPDADLAAARARAYFTVAGVAQ